MKAKDEEAAATLYQAATQTWVHAEQIRWTLLYNYLVVTSILLLAWAAVFSSGKAQKWVLILLASAGALMSLIWIFLLGRANSFADHFHKTMLRWEKAVRLGVGDEQSNPVPLGPVARTGEVRDILGKRPVLGKITTSRVLTYTPAMFALLYGFLVWRSLCPTV